jgi:hypothetical protein
LRKTLYIFGDDDPRSWTFRQCVEERTAHSRIGHSRAIISTTPHRASMLESALWLAKQMNLVGIRRGRLWVLRESGPSAGVVEDPEPI